MTPIGRRPFMVAVSAATAGAAVTAYALDALPDARFVGFAQAVDDFGITSGNLAIARSTNEKVRDYATRAIAEYNEASAALRTSRMEANVAYEADGKMGPSVQDLLSHLSSLRGAAFDAAFVKAQLTVLGEAVAQYGAYAQSGASVPLRRYAQRSLPNSQKFLEDVRHLGT